MQDPVFHVLSVFGFEQYFKPIFDDIVVVENDWETLQQRSRHYVAARITV